VLRRNQAARKDPPLIPLAQCPRLRGPRPLRSDTDKSTAFSVLVDTASDPVDARIIADLLVLRIDTDDLVSRMAVASDIVMTKNDNAEVKRQRCAWIIFALHICV
jgi:hypothetical protein